MFFRILFFLHLLLNAALAIFLTFHGLISNPHAHHFHPLKWYPPLLASTACGGILGFTWQWITSSHTTKALKATFWLSPLLTCAMGSMFVYIGIGSTVSFVVGVVSLVSALIQFLYGLWVSPRFDYATRILTVSIAFPPAKTKVLALSSIIISVLYCGLLVSGIGGARTLENRIVLAVFLILVMLLSLGWTMHFLKNSVQVTISRVKHMHFASGVDMEQTSVAFGDTIKYAGSVAAGSILVPIIGIIRSFVRWAILISGDAYLVCADCYLGLATQFVTHGNECGNRWGFVHVGVYNKGFMQASHDTWEMFNNRVGMRELIDLDLTGAFCFLSGVAVGAVCSLVSGIWSLVMHSSYAMGASILAFFIGYFLVRTKNLVVFHN